jgi:hypothetical protein
MRKENFEQFDLPHAELIYIKENAIVTKTMTKTSTTIMQQIRRTFRTPFQRFNSR